MEDNNEMRTYPEFIALLLTLDTLMTHGQYEIATEAIQRALREILRE